LPVFAKKRRRETRRASSAVFIFCTPLPGGNQYVIRNVQMPPSLVDIYARARP
jgi:hypothetical protein